MRFFFVAAVALILGCGEESEPARPPPGFTSGSSGASGAGGGSGASSGNGSGSSGAGGADAGPIPNEAGPADPPCTSDLAFWASGMSFSSPTPKDLGLALNELTYEVESHSISIVLLAKAGVASATLAVSATEDNGTGTQIFPPASKPDFVPALLSYGGFKSGAPQSSATLRLVDKAGPVDIALNGITITASTKMSCSNIVAVVDAFIPASEGGKTLHLKSGDATIASLGGISGGGEKDAGVDSWPIHAIFLGETISFDFTTLP